MYNVIHKLRSYHSDTFCQVCIQNKNTPDFVVQPVGSPTGIFGFCWGRRPPIPDSRFS